MGDAAAHAHGRSREVVSALILACEVGGAAGEQRCDADDYTKPDHPVLTAAFPAMNLPAKSLLAKSLPAEMSGNRSAGRRVRHMSNA